MSPDREDIPHNPGAINVTALLKRQLPSSQEKQGNDNLELACETRDKFKSVITEGDKRAIDDKIICALDMKEVLDTKSGISKFKHARLYCRASRDAYRSAKVAFACDFSYCI
jgi:hypothetical protein